MDSQTNPYRTPPLPLAARTAEAAKGRMRAGGAALLGASFAFGATTLWVMAAVPSEFHPGVGVLGFGSASALALLGAKRSFEDTGPAGSGAPVVLSALWALVLGFMNLAMAAGGAFFAFMSTVTFSRGRQLRRFGRAALPAVEPGDAWSRREIGGVTLDPVPDPVAMQWRENGKTEHASVAAFARLTLDLVALGAPPRLVEAANADALDEIRHAEQCFSLARAIDGRDESPAPFPEAQRVSTLPRARSLALAKLAVDSLIDGALNEGVSARVVAALSRRAEDESVRQVLRGIAADEGRHAAHGWEVVEWCLAEGGTSTAHALRGAASALPERMRSTLPPDAERGDWERWGIAGRALEDAHYTAARAHVAARIARLTGAAAAEPGVRAA